MAEEKIEKGAISEEALKEIAGGINPATVTKLAKTYAIPATAVISLASVIVTRLGSESALKEAYQKGKKQAEIKLFNKEYNDGVEAGTRNALYHRHNGLDYETTIDCCTNQLLNNGLTIK